MADDVGRVGIVGAAPSSSGLGLVDCTAGFSSVAAAADKSGVFSAVRASLPVRRGMR